MLTLMLMGFILVLSYSMIFFDEGNLIMYSFSKAVIWFLNLSRLIHYFLF